MHLCILYICIYAYQTVIHVANPIVYNHEVYLYMLTLATRCHNVCNSMIDVYRPVTEVTAVSESMLCIIYLCDNITLV